MVIATTRSAFVAPRTTLFGDSLMFKSLLVAFCAAVVAAATPIRADVGVSRDFKVPIEIDTNIRVLTSKRYDGSTPRPVLLFLHGYCLSDDGQQTTELTSMRLVPAPRNALNVDRRRQQTLVQTGLREAALEADYIYVAPDAPHVTRECVLCNLQDASPNQQDRLFASWITGILERNSPQMTCRAWDGSDACCNPELGGNGDDVAYILRVLKAVKAKFNVDENKVYVFGIATGGFMANRLACEVPEIFKGIASFAGGSFKDRERCKPRRATSVLEIHGSGDLTVPLSGGVNARGVAFPSAEETFDIISGAMKCSNSVDESTSTLPADGGQTPMIPSVKVRESKRKSCADGVHVEQWILDGVEHFMEKSTSAKLFENAVEWFETLS